MVLNSAIRLILKEIRNFGGLGLQPQEGKIEAAKGRRTGDEIAYIPGFTGAAAVTVNGAAQEHRPCVGWNRAEDAFMRRGARNDD